MNKSLGFYPFSSLTVISPAPKITLNSKQLDTQSNTNFLVDYGISEVLNTITWVKRLKYLLSEMSYMSVHFYGQH